MVKVVDVYEEVEVVEKKVGSRSNRSGKNPL